MKVFFKTIKSQLQKNIYLGGSLYINLSTYNTNTLFLEKDVYRNVNENCSTPSNFKRGFFTGSRGKHTQMRNPQQLQ